MVVVALLSSACSDPCADYNRNPPDAPWQPEIDVVVRDASTQEIIPEPTFRGVDASSFITAGCAKFDGGVCQKWHVGGAYAAIVGADGYDSFELSISLPSCGALIRHPNGCTGGCAAKAFEERTVALARLPPANDMATADDARSD